MKLLLVILIVVATIAVNICKTNAFPKPEMDRERAEATEGYVPATEGSYLIQQHFLVSAR